MKTRKLMTVLMVVMMSAAMWAQKTNPYLESYNYKRAMELLHDDENSTEAISLLEKEIAEHPKNGYAYFTMGLFRERHDMMGEALEKTNKAIELLQKDKKWLSYAYRQRARIYLALENEDAAMKDWNMAQRANPKDVQTYVDRAEYYCDKEKYAESNADFEKVCELEPGNVYGYMGIGRNAVYAGEYKKAEELFTRSIKLDPTYSQAYAFRAEAYLKQGMMNESIDDIIKALDMDNNSKAYVLMGDVEGVAVNTMVAKLRAQQNKQPGDKTWPFYIAEALEHSGKYLQAIEAFKECQKIDEGDVPYGRIARCYDKLEYFELALENINRAIELDPEDDDYVMTKADLLYDMGRGEEAVAVYDEYIKMSPDYYGGYYRRAFMKDNLNDTEGAIEDYTMAIALNPDYAYSYLGRADKYLLKGEKEAAMNDYRKVTELDTVCSGNNCAQYAYLGLGEKEKAKEFQAGILEHSPNAGNYYDAACLYARMGEKEESLKYLRLSFEKGFRRFAHIRNDDDLELIRDMEGYRLLMQEYEKKYEEELKEKRGESGVSAKRQEVTSEIPFTVESGNCYVKCRINELPMRFVFDTGASDVSLSMVEATFMMKNGYLSDKDVVGNAKYTDAIGNVSEGTVINLRKVEFGDVALDNVRASVVRNQKAPLLLGQSVLSRIGKIEIDNQKKVIRVRYMKEVEK